jgi:hypothetical protein
MVSFLVNQSAKIPAGDYGGGMVAFGKIAMAQYWPAPRRSSQAV